MLVMMTPSPASSERARVTVKRLISMCSQHHICFAEGPNPPQHPEGFAATSLPLSLLPGRDQECCKQQQRAGRELDGPESGERK